MRELEVAGIAVDEESGGPVLLEAVLPKVRLERMEEGICYASRRIRRSSGETVEVDARPSDSVALARRTGSPILIGEPAYEFLVQEIPGL